MKLWDPPKTWEGLKKRGQMYLLFLNIMVALINLFLLSTRLDRLDSRMVLYCRTVNFTDTVCQQQ